MDPPRPRERLGLIPVWVHRVCRFRGQALVWRRAAFRKEPNLFGLKMRGRRRERRRNLDQGIHALLGRTTEKVGPGSKVIARRSENHPSPTLGVARWFRGNLSVAGIDLLVVPSCH